MANFIKAAVVLVVFGSMVFGFVVQLPKWADMVCARNYEIESIR